jgi:hypothetical protein
LVAVEAMWPRATRRNFLEALSIWAEVKFFGAWQNWDNISAYYKKKEAGLIPGLRLELL